MKQSFLFKLKSKSIFVLKAIFLICLCTAIGIAIVWPLWFFAVNFPSLYTAVVLILILALILFFIVKKIVLSKKINLKK